MNSFNVVRGFCSSSVAKQMVKPPVQVFGMNGRYAMALYSAASKKKALSTVEKDMKDLQKLLKTDKVFRDFVLSPLVNKELKKSAIESVITKTKASPLTNNLLAAMTDNGRIKDIEGVADAFNTIMAAERGEIICEVTTAKELDAASSKELESILKTFVKKGESIQLSMKTDPSLIGGMVVSIGDKYVDMSMASKLNMYTDLIKQAV